MIEVEAVLVEPVLGGRVVPGGEQVLQHEDLVGAALGDFLLFVVAVPERSLRSLADVGQNRPAVTIAAASCLVRRVPNVSVIKLDGSDDSLGNNVIRVHGLADLIGTQRYCCGSASLFSSRRECHRSSITSL